MQASGDTAWLARNYGGVKKWVEAMLATDRDGNGLVKYAFSGNWNAMRGNDNLPANWWDAINFGHEDAYSNALAYRALGQMAAAADLSAGAMTPPGGARRRKDSTPPTSRRSSIRRPAFWPAGGAPTERSTTITSFSSTASPSITAWSPRTRRGRSWTG